jgi:hypothetical protein
MRNCLVTIILVIFLILPLAGCGGSTSGSAMKEELLIEGVVNENNLLLGTGGVELRLDPVIISSDVNAKISKISNAPPLDEEGDIQLDVYAFSLEGITQVDGVIQLAIPLRLAEGEIPGAAFLAAAESAPVRPAPPQQTVGLHGFPPGIGGPAIAKYVKTTDRWSPNDTKESTP